eukprot:g4176.t1
MLRGLLQAFLNQENTKMFSFELAGAGPEQAGLARNKRARHAAGRAQEGLDELEWQCIENLALLIRQDGKIRFNPLPIPDVSKGTSALRYWSAIAEAPTNPSTDSSNRLLGAATLSIVDMRREGEGEGLDIELAGSWKISLPTTASLSRCSLSYLRLNLLESKAPLADIDLTIGRGYRVEEIHLPPKLRLTEAKLFFDGTGGLQRLRLPTGWTVNGKKVYLDITNMKNLGQLGMPGDCNITDTFNVAVSACGRLKAIDGLSRLRCQKTELYFGHLDKLRSLALSNAERGLSEELNMQIWNCLHLHKINLPKGLACKNGWKIQGDVTVTFSGCTNLSKFIVPEDFTCRRLILDLSDKQSLAQPEIRLPGKSAWCRELVICYPI